MGFVSHQIENSYAVSLTVVSSRKLQNDMTTAWNNTSEFPGCIANMPPGFLLYLSFTTAGGISELHTDQHGVGTWIEIVDGEKLWVVPQKPVGKPIDFSLLQEEDSGKKVDAHLLQPGSVL